MSQEMKIGTGAGNQMFTWMGSSSVWITVLLIVILTALGFGTVSANEETAVIRAGLEYSASPELAAVERYRAAMAIPSEGDYLAGNPELKSVRRFEALEAARAAEWTLNPELMVVERLSGIPRDEVLEDTGAWVSNPELAVVNRFEEQQASAAGEVNLYENPELKVLAGPSMGAADASVIGQLGLNPELSTHQRFVEGSSP